MMGADRGGQIKAVLAVFNTLFYLLLNHRAFVSAQAQAQGPSIPAVLPTNWTSVGCFTDVSTSRSLRANQVTGANTTIESCLAFCQSGGWFLAGVEFGVECYCDGAIQVPGTQTPATDCDMACGGNSTELCGGPSRLNIFQNNAVKPPVLVQSTNGGGGNASWAYAGCFTDTPANRTLSSGINVPGGVTAETCTATCQTAGFKFAGLENGQECWCGNSILTAAQHVSDNDCRQVCSSTHAEFCGNANRVAIYAFGNSTGTGGTTPGGSGNVTCSSVSLTNFTLQGVVRASAPSGNGLGVGSKIGLKIVLVEMVPSVIWGILSACSLCCSDYPTFALSNSVFMPKSLSNPIQAMVSSSPNDGESPVFVASDPAFPGFQSYCAVDSAPGIEDPPLLAFGGRIDSFSLCTNLTQGQNDRMDVVFQPVTGHPHYNLDDCVPISIQVIT